MKYNPRRSFTLLFVSIFLAHSSVVVFAQHARADVEVIACEQLIPEGDTGYLAENLACPIDHGGVVLSDDSRLELNGHSITAFADFSEASPEQTKGLAGVRCSAGTKCEIVGPGVISGFAANGIAGTRVRVKGVTIRDNGGDGISAYETVRAEDTVIDGNGGVGVRAGWRVRLVRSEVGEHSGGAVLKRIAATRKQARSYTCE